MYLPLVVEFYYSFQIVQYFCFFISRVLYSVDRRKKKSMHGQVFRLLDTAQSSDTHPKTIRTRFRRPLLACLRASEPVAAT